MVNNTIGGRWHFHTCLDVFKTPLHSKELLSFSAIFGPKFAF